MCPAPMSMLAGLHLYPKTPKDLTVTTRLGGTVSLIGLVVMGFLFATELRAYMVPSLETSIELDDNAEKKLLISFNISLPHVPCHVASVDVKDVLGTRIANVTQNVFKRRSVLKVPWIRGPCSVPGSQLGARAGIFAALEAYPPACPLEPARRATIGWCPVEAAAALWRVPKLSPTSPPPPLAAQVPARCAREGRRDGGRRGVVRARGAAAEPHLA